MSIGWLLMGGGGIGGGHWVQGGFFARRRARKQVLAATEAELRERGLPIPKARMSPEKIVVVGLVCILLAGMLAAMASPAMLRIEAHAGSRPILDDQF